MEFDYSKLKGRIVEKFRTQVVFARALGVSERTLSLKLNNAMFFKQNEINKAVELLGIKKSDIKDYFFEEKV